MKSWRVHVFTFFSSLLKLLLNIFSLYMCLIRHQLNGVWFFYIITSDQIKWLNRQSRIIRSSFVTKTNCKQIKWCVVISCTLRCSMRLCKRPSYNDWVNGCYYTTSCMYIDKTPLFEYQSYTHHWAIPIHGHHYSILPVSHLNVQQNRQVGGE